MNKLAFIAAAGLASAAMADNFGPGTTGAFADNDPVGQSFTINVAGSGTIVSFDSLNLDISHTWVGDLFVTLEHNGTTVTILDRPGFPESAFGNNVDLVGEYNFMDGGAALPTAGTAAPGAYGLDNIDGSSLADFVGQDVNGTWTLFVSDNAGGDLGQLNAWSFDATIPAPGAAALFGLGGLAAARRRR